MTRKKKAKRTKFHTRRLGRAAVVDNQPFPAVAAIVVKIGGNNDFQSFLLSPHVQGLFLCIK
jgi:hypothetical protein